MTSNTKLRTALQAERDVASILRYTRNTWGAAQELDYEALLRNAFRRIQAFPEIGRLISGETSVLRELILEHHTIVYRYAGDTVTTLRVVNPRRTRR